MPKCPSCHVRRVVSYQRARDRNRVRAQSMSVNGAYNARKDWTGPELEIAARQDLSVRQVAEMLGRTLYAVKHARRKLKDDPKTKRLAFGGSLQVRERPWPKRESD